MLATPAFDAIEEGRRPSLITDVMEGVPWESKLLELGMKKSMQEKRSRLRVADLDWSLMDSWVERASERATGYGLMFLSTPIPDEQLQKWCDVLAVMETAPREDLDFEFTTWTPGKWRDYEEKNERAGISVLGHVAVDRSTAEFVGLSDIYVKRHQPDLAWQGDTGVHPDHRNKGLGRWLKAATIKRVMEEYPEIDRVDTFNAGSNEPMLNINIEMGFRQILVINAWQGNLAVVRERLGA